MSSSLGQVFFKVVHLPESEQDQIASRMCEAMESVADTAHWEQQIADSEDVLGMLHDEELREYQSGQTQPLEP